MKKSELKGLIMELVILVKDSNIKIGEKEKRIIERAVDACGKGEELKK